MVNLKIVDSILELAFIFTSREVSQTARRPSLGLRKLNKEDRSIFVNDTR
jgi:hypothetical protein